MRKKVVTLGTLESIKLKLGKNYCEKIKGILQEKFNIELRIIFESKDDKIFKLITDYIHLMNRRVCGRNKDDNNVNSCILCETIIQECETKNGKKKLSVLLSKSEDLEIFSDETDQQNEKDTGYYINWNIRDKQKHYELVGLLSESIISEFIFPMSILQYSNSRIFLTLLSSTSQELIWSSNTFLMSNFIKYKPNDGVENEQNNEDNTLIYLNILHNNNNNILYVYNESKNRIINKNQVKFEDIKKYKVKEIIERIINLHRILVNYRNHLENYHSLKIKCANQNKWIINENNNINNQLESFDINYEQIDKNHSKVLDNDDFNIIKLKKQEKVDEKEKIKNYIRDFEKKNHELNKLINQNKIDMEKTIVDINELNKEIDLYRNDLINKVSYCIYPITIEKKTSNFKIRNMLLPLINVIQNLDNKQDFEISTTLGFSLHYLQIIYNILELPCPNKIIVKGSFSTINNNPLYFYPNMNKKQITRALKFYKSIIYNILNYFNVNHQLQVI
ncbi:uncharacterized protein ELE39_002029 [Cryptosporidium sp. chipmunk genotype I]|uniref:uncharacterized protein n=1 Tax=Cryptosporidium sp. chipmunk genotype I TaxID=1280935 RepID=UPI00351A3567|nr:hypothetical protein ELE39_002029 [Cryptosporidium sp. chipmunk genotype I]